MRKLLMTACIIGFSQFLFGQDEVPAPPKNKAEEIVICNKGDKNMNMTIQIHGDSITVNGKPLSEFIDDQVSISKRKMMIHGHEGMMPFDLNDELDLGDLPQKMGKASSKPFLGVTTEKAKGGVKIVEIVEASAAEKAGLKEGDIITKVDEDKIDDPEKLSKVIKTKKPKKEIKIIYKRDGKEKEMKALLGEKKEKVYSYSFNGPMMRSFKIPAVPPIPNIDELDENDIPYIPDMSEFPKPSRKKVGLKIQDTEDGKVKVIAVEDSSTAAKAGIVKDDIITEIDGEKINNTDDAREQLHPEEGKLSYNIKINRNGKDMIFDVKIPRKLKTANL